MKHATPQALSRISGLLDRLEMLPRLKRRGIGSFYLRSKAFLHFHEDPAGLFADIAVGSDWERLPVNTPKDQDKLYEVASAAAMPAGVADTANDEKAR
jgi:hypothetical protein